MSPKFYAYFFLILYVFKFSEGFLYGNGGMGGLSPGFGCIPPFVGCFPPVFPCCSPCCPFGYGSGYGMGNSGFGGYGMGSSGFNGYGMGNSGFGGFNQGFSQYPLQQPGYRNGGNSGCRGQLPPCINNQSCGPPCVEEYCCKCVKTSGCCSSAPPPCPKQKGCGCYT